MKKYLLLLIVYCSFNCLYILAQTSLLLDSQAPEIQFKKILNSEQATASLATFTGKVVLIDFWATWCTPCLKSFDHLEALQQKFSKDLKIIMVTSDDENRITQFLTKFKTSLPIVLDEKQEIEAIFPHRTIPHTVVIDKNGTIRIISSPDMISEEVIQKVINQEAVKIAEKKEKLDFDPKDLLSGTHNVLFQITLTPYQEGIPSLSTRFREGRIMMTNLGLRSIYEIARRFPVYTRTIIEVRDPNKYKWSKESAYCLEIIAPDKSESEVFNIIIEYLHQNFSLKSKVEKRKNKVKVLKRISDKHLLKSADLNSESTYSSNGSGLSMVNSPITTLANFLEGQLNVPVVDETGIADKYDLEFPWYNENVKQYQEDLKKIGLELVDAEREIEMLVLYEE